MSWLLFECHQLVMRKLLNSSLGFFDQGMQHPGLMVEGQAKKTYLIFVV